MQQLISNVSMIIVEDHTIFTEGLQSILQQIDGIQIKGTFVDGESALVFLETHAVDIVFLDISLPAMSGIEVCKKIKSLYKATKIIALTNHTEKSIILNMLNSGADGYLLKNTSRNDLVTAIYQVMNGQFLMKSELQKLLFSTAAKTTDIPRLTRREQEVLQLVSDGATTAAIAEKLFISPQTVETHRHNLMQKFSVNNSASLIKKAVTLAIIK